MKTEIKEKHSYKEYVMFAEAWALMALSRILIFLMPFRKLLPLLGKPINQEEAEKAASKPTASLDLLKMIQKSILRASVRSPWRTKCFEQALTARMMLKKRKIKSVLYFGVSKNIFDTSKKDTAAHAWIICSGFTITGGRNNEIFTIVGRFSV